MSQSKSNLSESKIGFYIVLTLLIAPFVALPLYIVIVSGYELITNQRTLTQLEEEAWRAKCEEDNKGEFIAPLGAYSFCKEEVPTYIKKTEKVDLQTGNIVFKDQ